MIPFGVLGEDSLPVVCPDHTDDGIWAYNSKDAVLTYYNTRVTRRVKMTTLPWGDPSYMLLHLSANLAGQHKIPVSNLTAGIF